LNRNHTGIFSSIIFVHIGSEQGITLCRQDAARSEIYVPYPRSSKFNITDESGALIFGYRVIEIMVVNDFIETGKEYCFMFHNFELYYIAATVIRRFNAKLVVYRDSSLPSTGSVNSAEQDLIGSGQLTGRVSQSKPQELFLSHSDLVLTKDEGIKMALTEVYDIPKDKVSVWADCIFDITQGVERGALSLAVSELTEITGLKMVLVCFQQERNEEVIKLLSMLKNITSRIFIICGTDVETLPPAFRLAANFRIIGKVEKAEISELATQADLVLLRSGSVPGSLNLVDLMSRGVKHFYFDGIHNFKNDINFSGPAPENAHLRGEALLEMMYFHKGISHSGEPSVPPLSESHQKRQFKTLIDNIKKT
jgi:hypothetical protein